MIEHERRFGTRPDHVDAPRELIVPNADVERQAVLRQQPQPIEKVRANVKIGVWFRLDQPPDALQRLPELRQHIEVRTGHHAVFQRRPGDDARDARIALGLVGGPGRLQQAVGRSDVHLQVDDGFYG